MVEKKEEEKLYLFFLYVNDLFVFAHIEVQQQPSILAVHLMVPHNWISEDHFVHPHPAPLVEDNNVQQ